MAAKIWKSDKYGLSLSFYGSSVMTAFEFILSRNLLRAFCVSSVILGVVHILTIIIKPEIYSKLISICKNILKLKLILGIAVGCHLLTR